MGCSCSSGGEAKAGLRMKFTRTGLSEVDTFLRDAEDILGQLADLCDKVEDVKRELMIHTGMDEIPGASNFHLSLSSYLSNYTYL